MPVSAELHALVLRRDRCCFMFRMNPEHICRDQWGSPHSAYDLSKLTLDHVHLHSGGTRGKKAPDDEQHLIAMCANANIGGPSRVIRQAQRDYIRELYADVLERQPVAAKPPKKRWMRKARREL
jgi:hypothetical protein